MGNIFFYKNKIGIMYDTLKSLDVNLARNRCKIDNFGCINASVRCIYGSFFQYDCIFGSGFSFWQKKHLSVFLPVVGTPFTHWIFFDLIVIFTHRLDTNIFTMKKWFSYHTQVNTRVPGIRQWTINYPPTPICDLLAFGEC